MHVAMRCAVIMGIGLALTACNAWNGSPTKTEATVSRTPTTGLSIGQQAPDITGVSLDGKNLKLSDYRGKVVVLDFWASWCGYCMKMMPHARTLAKKYENKPVALLGVNEDQDLSEGRAAVTKARMTWPSWADPNGDISRAWKVGGYPTLYVIDQKGIIRFCLEGATEGAVLESMVERLLAEDGEAGKIS